MKEEKLEAGGKREKRNVKEKRRIMDVGGQLWAPLFVGPFIHSCSETSALKVSYGEIVF